MLRVSFFSFRLKLFSVVKGFVNGILTNECYQKVLLISPIINQAPVSGKSDNYKGKGAIEVIVQVPFFLCISV